jgi:hypothetical protein
MGIIWELDFYSRPVLDENKKKLWEVLICESSSTIARAPESLFRFAQYCPSATVNSLWLREAIEAAIAKSGTSPSKIRFFRRQMNNMILKACEDAGIPASPSRRTYDLEQWILERSQNFYPQEPSYDPKAATAIAVKFPILDSIPLPDAVRGDKADKWAFVTLPAKDLADMKEWEIAFGEAFSIDRVDLDPETPIPGFIIFSSRAIPLAGWLSGLELAYLAVNAQTRPLLRLETGASDSWILAILRDPALLAEAENFEQAKQKAQGIHFLAVQSSPESESFAGFWLLKETL